MDGLNFKTVLGVKPSNSFMHDILVITRGATADITYDLGNKFYNTELLDQITFVFKQNQCVFHYDMFNYLDKTSDTEAEDGKIYYTALTRVADDSLQVEATAVIDYTGNPKAAGYYEVVPITDAKNGLYWMLDDHFWLMNGLLTFTFSAEETKNLRTTTPDNNMLFEVVFRLDTDDLESNKGKDSIIIEPQHAIAVRDSIYSQILPGNGLTVSASPWATASTGKTVKD